MDLCLQFGVDYGYDYDYDGHTGDPRLDIEYERERGHTGASYIVPEVIKVFLSDFYTAIMEQNLYEIQNLYDNGLVYFCLTDFS